MKKLITLLLTICLCTTMTACGNKETENSSKANNADTKSSSVEKQDTATPEDGAHTLVVYFSCTGNTKTVAEHIANGLNTDIYEIVAEDPYTDADLDYSDNNSRSTIEMNDESVRPAIATSVDDMEQYDTVYIGYPVWWGEAPRILATFVETYNFADKTIIPFCTSASSGIGSSASGLEELAGNGTWLDGRRFSGNESADEVMEWVNSL